MNSANLSVRDWILSAPDPLTLRTVCDRARVIPCSPATRRKWEEAIYLRARDFVRDYSGEGLWVYNSLFIFLTNERQTALFAYVQQQHTRHAKVQTQLRSATP